MANKIPYYSEDPTLKGKRIVITIEGEKEYKENTKKYSDGYYVIGKHLKLKSSAAPNSKDPKDWIKRSDIFFDNENKKFVSSTNNMIEGIVSIDEAGNEKIGYFTPNNYKNCLISGMYDGNRDVICMDYEMLPTHLYIENISRGFYVRRAPLSDRYIKDCNTKKLSISNNNNSYNIVDNPSEFKDMCDSFNKSKIKISKEFRELGKYIKGITFGAELESINGTLPAHLRHKYGVIICKDGSIKNRDGSYPPEYVTVPFSGAKGLQALYELPKELSKRSDIDNKCSYHLHLGGFEIDRLFIISLFKLCNKIQNDVFKMFPYYKNNEVKYAGKEKNYCKKLPELVRNYVRGDFNNYVNQSYEDVFIFLTGGKRFDNVHNYKARSNPWGGAKWNINTRYYWVNFTNIVFGKQDTIEFRIHTPTLNSDKVLNWLLMCNAIIGYVQTNQRKCISKEPIRLVDVLNYYKDTFNTAFSKKLSENLIAYYNERVEYFENDFKREDYISEADIKNDSTYNFNILK